VSYQEAIIFLSLFFSTLGLSLLFIFGSEIYSHGSKIGFQELFSSNLISCKLIFFFKCWNGRLRKLISTANNRSIVSVSTLQELFSDRWLVFYFLFQILQTSREPFLANGPIPFLFETADLQ
jgi:hypothetical protein